MHELEAYLNDTAGEPVQELYDYLRDETDYPMDLIWKNMIRTMHPHDFTRNLALTRIIEPTVLDEATAQSIRQNRRIALAMHLYFMDMLDSSKAFAAKFPPETDIFISTSSADKKPQIEAAFADLNVRSVTVTVVENQAATSAPSSVTWPRSCGTMTTPASCTTKKPSRPAPAASARALAMSAMRMSAKTLLMC